MNSISPGYTATPMDARPEMVGPAVFLLSDAASYCTGVDLLVDAGFCCWQAPASRSAPFQQRLQFLVDDGVPGNDRVASHQPVAGQEIADLQPGRTDNRDGAEAVP